MGNKLHIIMPVKDSIATTKEALEHLYSSDTKEWMFCLYDDFSTSENAAELDSLAKQYGFDIVHWADRTDHPSPNYRLTLIDAQQKALADNADLLIIESDVLIQPDTIRQLQDAKRENTGMVASVTKDREGKVNFPYLYAKRWPAITLSCLKRFSFCCTLLTNQLLRTIPFEQLDSEKEWFDVTISHMSLERGMNNLLVMQAPVVHLPHSSRPWKKLKYTNPIKYYWQKLTKRRDRI